MLHRTKAMLLAGGLVATLATPGCDPATAIALPALIITNTWGVEDQEREFSFLSDDDQDGGVTSGSFEGREVVDGFDVHTLTGTWADGTIEFTTSDGTDYSGTFEDLPDRLEVSSATEDLVLIRGG
jgi:hypothetical protein